MNMESHGEMISTGKTKDHGEEPVSATLSTTNPTCTDPCRNPGLRGKRLATNRVNHGTALRGGVSSAESLELNINIIL
jgi:hypothetical protein